MTQPLPNQILGDRLMVISKIFGCCAHQLSSGHQRSQFFSKFASSWGRRPSPGNFQNTRLPSIIMIKERYAGCGFIGQSHIRWCPQATGHKMSFAKSNCKRTGHRLPASADKRHRIWIPLAACTTNPPYARVTNNYESALFREGEKR